MALPPTDEELAAGERTDIAQRARAIAIGQDEQEQHRLAKAGEPDAKLALAATAAVSRGRPLQEETGELLPGFKSPLPALGNWPMASQATKSNPSVRGRPRQTTKAAEPPAASIEEVGRIQARDLTADQQKAYELMDIAFRKWRRTAASDIRRANRELARDLGGDTAIFLKNNILRLPDMLDAMNKLMMLTKPSKEEDPESEDFEAELTSMREALRDGK